MTRPAILLSALAALALCACETTPPEPEPSMIESEVVAGSDRLLWKIVLLSLRKMDFPESAEMDPTNMKAVSGWKVELSPWKGRGFRQQAEVTCTPIGPGRWEIETRVKKQVNQSLARPLDLSYAEWEWVPDDVEAARILLQHIRTFLNPSIELSEDEEDPVDAYLRKIEER